MPNSSFEHNGQVFARRRRSKTASAVINHENSGEKSESSKKIPCFCLLSITQSVWRWNEFLALLIPQLVTSLFRSITSYDNDKVYLTKENVEAHLWLIRARFEMEIWWRHEPKCLLVHLILALSKRSSISNRIELWKTRSCCLSPQDS